MISKGSFQARQLDVVPLTSQRGEQIDPACCGVAVGWSSPGCAAATKGAGVHRLKGHLSWVQNGVSQFGLYLLEVLLPERKEG